MAFFWWRNGKSKNIFIKVIDENSTKKLTFTDDGVGFDESKTKTASSGWHNIKSRVNYLQGTLNLHTDPTAGTSVTVSIPLK